MTAARFCVCAILVSGCEKKPPAAEPDATIAETAVTDPCGDAPWGSHDDSDVFVDGAAASGGDGSPDRPFRTIADGVARGGVVAVAAGTYLERLALDEGHDGLVLVGRCASLVVIDGDLERDEAVLLLDGAASTRVEVRDLRITRGGLGGALVGKGTLALTGVDFTENATIGILAVGRSSTLEATDVTVTATQSDRNGDFGRGVEIDPGATATLIRVTVDGAREGGIWLAEAGPVSLTDCTVVNTVASDNGDGGYGVVADSCDTLTLDGLTVSGSENEGIAISDTTARGGRLSVTDAREAGIAVSSGGQVYLDGVSITATTSPPRATEGWGLSVSYGSFAQITSLTVDGNEETGILVYQSDAELDGFSVTGTLPTASDEGGMGIYAYDGTLTLSDGEVSGNSTAGVYLLNVVATLTDVDVRDTRPTSTPLSGSGVSVFQGTTLTMIGGEITENVYTGVDVWDGTGTMDGTLVRGTVADASDEGGYGVAVVDGSFSITGARLEGNAVGGAVAAGSGATLDVTDTVVDGGGGDGQGRRGISFEQAASGSIVDSTVSGVSDIGVHISGEGVVDIAGLDISGAPLRARADIGRGLNVQEGSTVTATRLTISGAPQTGIFVGSADLNLEVAEIRDGFGDATGAFGVGIVARYGSQVSTTDLTILRAREVGVLASDEDTTVRLDGATITDTLGSTRYGFALGAAAQLDATIVLVDASIGEQPGPALYVNGGGVVDGTDVDIGASQLAGVVLLGGDLTLNGGTVDAEADVGVFFRADTAASARLTDVAIGVNRYAAAWFEGPGAWDVDGGTFAAGTGVAERTFTLHGSAIVAHDVDAWSGGNGLRLDGVELYGGPGPAVLLDHASAEIGPDVRFDSPSVDLWQQDCEGVASPPPGDLSSLQVELCPERWAVMAPVTFWLSLIDAPAAGVALR